MPSCQFRNINYLIPAAGWERVSTAFSRNTWVYHQVTAKIVQESFLTFIFRGAEVDLLPDTFVTVISMDLIVRALKSHNLRDHL